jgi:hypothetical protein
VATKFERVVDAIKAQLDSDWPSNGVEFTKGRLALQQNDVPKRVGWVRTGGRATDVDGAGSKQFDSEVSPGTTVAAAAILTDTYDVEAFVWGTNDDEADRIREAIIRAAHKTLSNRTAEAGAWQDNTQTEDGAAWETLGAQHRIEFIFRVPIREFEDDQPTALLTSHSETYDYVTQTEFEDATDDLELPAGP